MSSSSDSEDLTTPPELKVTAQEVIENLPEKSKNKYNKAYEDFLQWKSEKNAHSFSENVLLSYFNEKAQKYKSSTLWSLYSMLKSTILAKNDINIMEYKKLTQFLKRKSEGFRSKKSKVFTTKDVFSFLRNAPDAKYLLMKTWRDLRRKYRRLNVKSQTCNAVSDIKIDQPGPKVLSDIESESSAGIDPLEESLPRVTVIPYNDLNLDQYPEEPQNIKTDEEVSPTSTVPQACCMSSVIMEQFANLQQENNCLLSELVILTRESNSIKRKQNSILSQQNSIMRERNAILKEKYKLLRRGRL